MKSNGASLQPRPPENKKDPRLQFEFADGIRALAAIAIVLFHSYIFTGHSGDAVKYLPGPMRILGLFNLAVPIFIVLSGFVLMLPLVKTTDLLFRGGALSFLRRRTRRILPPYFAAIGIFLIASVAIAALRARLGISLDSKIPISTGGVISHIFLVHNLNPAWVLQIDGPTWSVATEWQIYFLMPLLLIPLWRRFGALVSIGVAVLVGWLIHYTLPGIDSAHLWYIGLFAFGMAAAQRVVHKRDIPGLGVYAAAAVVISLILLISFQSVAERNPWFSEVGVGAVVAVVLVWLGLATQAGKKNVIHTILEHKFLVWIGLWSYSIYLIHSPLLSFGNLFFMRVHMSTLMRFIVEILIVLPVALAVAYLFHRIVERPFMTSHQKAVEHSQERAS